MKKTILLILLSLAIIFTFVACGDPDDSDKKDNESDSESVSQEQGEDSSDESNDESTEDSKHGMTIDGIDTSGGFGEIETMTPVFP